MKKVSLGLLVSALLSTAAVAQVQLNVDDNIKVTAINGQAIHHGLLQPLQQNFTLEPGRHVITARYDRLFKLGRDDHDYLKSGDITITANLADHQTYRLIMPNQPKDYHAAKDYIKTPSLAITQYGAIITQEDTTQTKRSGLFGGITSTINNLFGRTNSATTANQEAIAAISTYNTAKPTDNHAVRADDNLDGFMQIWLNASDEEREKIRQWIEK